MTEQTTATATTATPPEQIAKTPQHPGALAEVAGWFHRGETDAEKIAASASAMLTDHAGQVLDVGGDFLAMLSLIDPADAPLAASAQALLAKVLSMAETFARDARTALQPQAPPS